MKTIRAYVSSAVLCLLLLSMTLSAFGQAPTAKPGDTLATQQEAAAAEELATDSLADDQLEEQADDEEAMPTEAPGFHKMLKTKFIEGDASFMSLVALALVLGLAFCIERIIYLNLSEINARKFMDDLDKLIVSGDVEKAKALCADTRGPVASICSEGLMRINESMENIQRSITSYGTIQSANLEKGFSWITLFIAIAPSLGFLGTVIGMVMAFEQIQLAGDINPSIVAAGMKVALITTIFGIIVALILQLFYNYILSKADSITAQMEESAVSLLDSIEKYKQTHHVPDTQE